MPTAELAPLLDDRILNARRRITLNHWREEFVKAVRNLGLIVRRCREDKEQPWLAEYPSFEAFALAEWGIGKSRIYQLCAGENVRDMLAAAPETAAIAPTLTEAQLREIARAPASQRPAIVAAAKAAEPSMPVRVIRQARGRIVDGATGKPEPEPQCCPACGQRIRKP